MAPPIATTTTATTTTTTEPSSTNVIHLQQGISRKVQPASSDSKSFTSIPTLDLSRMYSDSLSERQALASELRDAASKVGFIQIRNHGVNEEVIEKAFEQTKMFFDLPVEEKMKVHQHLSRDFQGYEPLYETNVGGLKRGDCKESFQFAYNPADDIHGDQNMPAILRRECQWPDEAVAPLFRATMVRYQMELLAFARRFIRIFALALGLPENSFERKMTHPVTGVRALHYPPMRNSNEEEETSLGAQTDIEFFTIIIQTLTPYPALEVLNASGQWIPIIPQAGCFVVNLGDMMMRLTNDTFLATVHRVINRGDMDRYSIPFFFGINANELITTLESCITEENPLKEGYETGMTIFDHTNNRLKVARHKHPNAQKLATHLPKKYIAENGVPLYPDEQ